MRVSEPSETGCGDGNRTGGRHAVERDGLPTRPVGTLRDTFREVEYGERPASERVERARRAALAIEREVTEREEDR